MKEIREEFPQALQHQERYMLREYLQYLMLQLIYSSPYANKLQFIWWTALRILHQTQRFSEDLDFDNSWLSQEEFDDLIAICVKGLELYGFNVERTITNKDAMHGYIKFLWILADFGMAPMMRKEVQEKLVIRIDTHDQGYEFEPEKTILTWFGTQSVVHVAPVSLLMSHKILTIWERKRAKWRDYYDLVYLMSKKIMPDMHFLEQKLDLTTNEQVKSYLLWVIEKQNITFLQKDVLPFLFHQHDDSISHFALYVENYAFV